MQMLLKVFLWDTYMYICSSTIFTVSFSSKPNFNFLFQKYIFFHCSLKIRAHYHIRKASGGRVTSACIMHGKTIFSADRRQRRLLYSSVSGLVNLCTWEWMQSEGKEQNLHFGKLAVSMQTYYTIASWITLIPLMVMILISNAFNALGMGCFRGHPFFFLFMQRYT